MKPKLSVYCITYNHGPFIGQALDSFLAQQTTFDFEIVVGDDASKDNTQEVLRSYQQRFPDKIRLLLHEKNRGAIYNFIDTYDACRGEYLALCEGDDYWTDPLKLQKQVEFMDSHPDFSMCFHNAEVIYQDGSAPSYLLNHNQKEVVTVSDLIGNSETWFMATASIVLRKTFLPKLPDWISQSKSGDIPLNILLAQRGPVGYINEVMSVYRKHAGGQSNTDHRWEAHFLFNRINMYEHLDRETGYAYTDRFKRTMAEFYWLLPDTADFENRFWPRLKYTLKAVNYHPEAFRRPLATLLKEKILTPGQLAWSRRLRGLK
ncbi:glycosyltransferase [Siphonobacter aquaeclarae]|uniref:Glycosyl transferase family 2 n=1 Tax=Siphonobacter aquaeclarae TaxID=563176 RepID=A0A1G9K6M0_9BACT|nr:glycosyltransferase [Siphonobacter aquaeclarae]SDL45398.1 Glycosyl transferase family 2 [Siphonobacter aquaeclarae]